MTFGTKGVETIGRFLASISDLAGLSYISTNHCIRGTTVTGMKVEGHTLVEIAHVLKQKSRESQTLFRQAINERQGEFL